MPSADVPVPGSRSLPTDITEEKAREACAPCYAERRWGKETEPSGKPIFMSIPRPRWYCMQCGIGCGPNVPFKYQPSPSWRPGAGQCVPNTPDITSPSTSTTSTSSTSPAPTVAQTPSSSSSGLQKYPGTCAENNMVGKGSDDSSWFVERNKKFCMVCPTNTTYKKSTFGLGTCVTGEKSAGMETRFQKQQRQAREATTKQHGKRRGGTEEKKFCLVCSPQNRVGGTSRAPSKKIQIKYNKQAKIMWYENGKRVAGSKLSPDVRLFVMRKYQESKRQQQ